MENKNDIELKNIYQKIEYVKRQLSLRELKQSGHNDFAKFTYYELGDFLPSIIELCNEVGLFTKVSFEPSYSTETTITEDGTKTERNKKDGELAILTIVNVDNTEEHIEYYSDVKNLQLKGTNDVQNYGGVQTYLRRYLYMNAFDIVQADVFDSEGFERQQTQKKEKADIDKLIADTKEAFKNADDEIKQKIGDTMKTLGYSTFKDLSEKQDKNDVISLAEILGVKIPKKLLKDEVEEGE